MPDLSWPTSRPFVPNRFVMRVESTTRDFPSPYSQQMQVVDLMADFWVVQMAFPVIEPRDTYSAGQWEAFLDRLKASANRALIWNMKRAKPLGTLSGSPTLSSAAAQFANTLNIACTTGQTAYAGDMIGVGGQTFRVMTDSVSVGGVMPVEVSPRVRAIGGIASGSAVTLSAPTVPMRLVSKNPSLDWSTECATPPQLEWREDV